MKIGIFDSGLGGLIVMRRIVQKLPQYDYIYLGDSERVPYGTRSSGLVYRFTRDAVEYLFKRGCKVVILACNTASAHALRRLQREYLPKHYPDRRILGVIAPTVESAGGQASRRVGVIATPGTVASGVYPRELRKRNRSIKTTQVAAPLLVPAIESGERIWYVALVKSYLQRLPRNLDALILGCTHYPIIKSQIRKVLSKSCRIISQDEIVPASFADYLGRHKEIESKLSKNRTRAFIVTDLAPQYGLMARRWFGQPVRFKIISLDS